MSDYTAFYSAFLNIHLRGVLTVLAWLVPHETAAVSARSVYTIHPCTVSLHAKSHTQVHACLMWTSVELLSPGGGHAGYSLPMKSEKEMFGS